MPKDDRGVYVLVIDLKSDLDIRVGKLGTTSFSSGKHLYVGRAKRYLNGRLKRHLRRDKKTFWHIDYLLQDSHLEDIWIKRGFVDECQTTAAILSACPAAFYPVKGFGSSDCRCPSHLIYLPIQEMAFPELLKDIEFERADIHENQT